MSVCREKLYEEIWAESATTVAKRYGVSSSFLARVCERLNVPRPPRGYWAKRMAGARPGVRSLPGVEPGCELEWVRDRSPVRYAPLVVSVRKRAPRAVTHRLIAGAHAYFDDARSSDDDEYIRPYKRKLVDVSVSKSILDRALGVANALFLFLERRGQRVMLAPSTAQYVAPNLTEREGRDARVPHWRPARSTITVVGDVVIGLSLFEISAESPVQWDEAKQKCIRVTSPPTHERACDTYLAWLPSGRLGLHAFTTRADLKWERYWREPRAGKLESMFGAIANDLEAGALRIKELMIVAARAAEEERIKDDVRFEMRQREEVARRVAEAETQRACELQDIIARWRLARDVRSYVSEMQTAGHDDEKARWALEYADRIDPVSRSTGSSGEKTPRGIGGREERDEPASPEAR